MSHRMKVVKLFLSSRGGIILVGTNADQEEETFEAVWSHFFDLALKIDESTTTSLEMTMTRVREWDPDIVELDDLGSYPIYISGEGEDVEVSLEPREGSEQKTAQEAPIGAFLAGYAEDLFIAWRGRNAVEGRILKIDVSVGAEPSG